MKFLIRHKGKTYSAFVNGSHVSFDVDNEWAGHGRLSECGAIVRAPQIIPEAAYIALEMAINAESPIRDNVSGKTRQELYTDAGLK